MLLFIPFPPGLFFPNLIYFTAQLSLCYLCFFMILLSNFRGNGHPVQIVQRYHFASHLKRMAVVVRIQEEFFAFVKVCYILNVLSRNVQFLEITLCDSFYLRGGYELVNNTSPRWE
jgi:magnesium-transporting ATPase (P-type)